MSLLALIYLFFAFPLFSSIHTVEFEDSLNLCQPDEQVAMHAQPVDK